jgi:predicted flap endonuclease-1-like 5' DNA nuclease
MWIALAGAALLALALGWSIRGMLLLGKLRRAEVDRDVARVELGEAREEIERLFASQRKLLSGQGDTQVYEAMQVSPQADPALEQQLAETAAALQAARSELEALRSAPPVLAPAPELAALPVADGAHMQKTRELEDRVAGLEADLAEARRALGAAELARAEAVAAAPAPLAAPPSEADPKLVWKVEYLTQRVKALEGEVAAQPVLATLPAPVAEPGAAAEAPAARAAEESAEEELASLRWRNRYLEGRLAYFEGDAESVAGEIEEAGEDIDPQDDAAVALADEDDAAADFAEEDEEDEEDEGASAAEAILGRLEKEDALADAGEPGASAAPVRPLALERPVEGTPDDLTLIGGIGPRIQDVLNSLGIYHYDQIAEWTLENIAWVDAYLNFHGRVKREGWVEQAAVLVGEGAEP